jgi:hypothetical protein
MPAAQGAAPPPGTPHHAPRPTLESGQGRWPGGSAHQPSRLGASCWRGSTRRGQLPWSDSCRSGQDSPQGGAPGALPHGHSRCHAPRRCSPRDASSSQAEGGEAPGSSQSNGKRRRSCGAVPGRGGRWSCAGGGGGGAPASCAHAPGRPASGHAFARTPGRARGASAACGMLGCSSASLRMSYKSWGRRSVCHTPGTRR